MAENLKLRLCGTPKQTASAAALASALGWTVTDGEADITLDCGRKGAAVCSRLAWTEKLEAAGLPLPAQFPGGSDPYMVRPDTGSGAMGFGVIEDYCEVGGAVNAGFLCQEYLEGPVYQCYTAAGKALGCARLTCDEGFHAVSAEPCEAPGLDALAIRSAEVLGIQGVFSIKAVQRDGGWVILSADDRITGPAPAALLASGVNLLEAL